MTEPLFYCILNQASLAVIYTVCLISPNISHCFSRLNTPRSRGLISVAFITTSIDGLGTGFAWSILFSRILP
jgi:hypothetical protein